MLDRRGFLTALVATSGCALRLPPAPSPSRWTWSPERASLPEVSVRALTVATVQMSPHQSINGEKDRTKRLAPIAVYVLEHPTEGLLVVDTGYGRRTAADPADYPGRLATRLLGLKMKSPLVDRLGDIGRSAGDLRHALITHLHHDHGGGIEDLPPTTQLWVHEREWFAGAQRGALGTYDPLPYAGRSPTYFPFVGSAPYGPFPHHVDFFGDGTVIVLDAPGHTAGEVCVLVNRPTRSYLFTGDAAWVDRNWQDPAPIGPLPARLLVWDWRRSYDQLWRIHEWAERCPDLTVISGHEPANLDRLPAWPGTFA